MNFIVSTIKKIFNLRTPEQNAPYMTVDQRIEMTTSCRDSDPIPKVSNAGQILDLNGTKVQIMHNGTRVIADGYCGEWVTKIIAALKGHHEPQEELIFHHILKSVKPESLMIELGSWWAYYTSWFLSSVKNARAICIEPDKNNLECGQRNLKLNNQEAIFINAYIGKHVKKKSVDSNDFDEEDQQIPFLDFADILDAANGEFIELIHMDIQGAELAFLNSMEGYNLFEKVRFVFISTHHESISGSLSTHQDCISKLINLGAIILTEHSIEESFSGDGLIVASFQKNDDKMKLPLISRNIDGKHLFNYSADSVNLNPLNG
jgi:FkbM family methyltransferase